MSTSDQKQAVQAAARQAIHRSRNIRTFRASAAISLPFLYLLHRLIQHRYSAKTVQIIILVAIFAFTATITKLIRLWLYKQPANSEWYKILD